MFTVAGVAASLSPSNPSLYSSVLTFGQQVLQIYTQNRSFEWIAIHNNAYSGTLSAESYLPGFLFWLWVQRRWRQPCRRTICRRCHRRVDRHLQYPQGVSLIDRHLKMPQAIHSPLYCWLLDCTPGYCFFLCAWFHLALFLRSFSWSFYSSKKPSSSFLFPSSSLKLYFRRFQAPAGPGSTLEDDGSLSYYCATLLQDYINIESTAPTSTDEKGEMLINQLYLMLNVVRTLGEWAHSVVFYNYFLRFK